jgi:hypothetical protein
MKKWLFSTLLIGFSTVAAHAQDSAVLRPDCVATVTFSAGTGGRAIFDNRGLITPVCTTWHLVYSSNGYSALSIELDAAPTAALGDAPGTWVIWPASNIPSGTLPLTNTAQAQITGFKYFPWVSINVTSLTGTGVIRANLYGYRPGFLVDVNSAAPLSGGTGTTSSQVQGTAATGSAPVGNPVFVAGFDGTNVRPLSTSTASGGPATLAVANQVVGADGVSNAGGLSNLASAQTAPGLLNPLAVAPWLYDGAAVNQWDRSITCPNTSTFSVSAVAGTTVTQVVAAVAGQKVRVCSLDINPATVVAGSTDVVYGTGTNCATGITTLTGAYTLPAASVVDITPSTLSASSPLTTPVAQAVCVRAIDGAGTLTVNGFIVWEQH